MKKLIVNASTSMLILFGTIQNYSCTKEAATAPNPSSAIINKNVKDAPTQFFPHIKVYIDTI